MEQLRQNIQEFQGYVLEERISQNHSSVLWKVRDPKSGQNLAIKILFYDEMFLKLQREKIVSPCHPYLMKIIKLDLDSFPPYYIMPWMNLGNLQNFIIHKQSVQKMVEITRMILLTLVSLHSQGIVHGRIKAENILFQSPCMLYISDWGWNPQASMSDDIDSLGRMLQERMIPFIRTNKKRDLPFVSLLKRLQENSTSQGDNRYPHALAMLDDLHKGQKEIYCFYSAITHASLQEKIIAIFIDGILLASIFILAKISFWDSMIFWGMYFFLLEGSTGTTVGKKLLGLEIVRKSGQKRDLGIVLWRIILFYTLFPIMPFLYFLDKKADWYDRMAGTIVKKNFVNKRTAKIS